MRASPSSAVRRTQIYTNCKLKQGAGWQAGDSNAVVVSQRIANQKGWVVGDIITIEEKNCRELQAEIVGTVLRPGYQHLIAPAPGNLTA